MTIRASIVQVACSVVLGIAAVGLTACSSDPQAAALKYTASGDAYLAKGQYKEAIIEFRNALKATPNAADIRYKLGRVYQDSGELVKAYAEYARAADLEPSNVDAQLRAGTLLLVAREFDAARIRAELALKTDPSHVPAHILLGNANAGLNEPAPALREIEQAISLDPEYAPAWTALGAVTFIGGRKAEAAAAFQKAVELAPKSIDARLALANYHWATGAVAEAEQTLNAALQIDANNAAAHRALALLYVTTRRTPEAERHFRALAVDAEGRLALADYYMGVGRNADALTLLGALEKSTEKSTVREARLRTAAIHYGAGRKADAHRIVDELIKERPRYAEARTAKARMLLSDGAAPAAALAEAREAVKANADLPAAHYTLGLAAVAARKLAEAERAFEDAARVSPRAAAARMQIARLKLARGETAAAVSAAELAATERPADVEAAVLLSQTLRADGNLHRAGRELTRRLAERPANAAPLHVEMGWLELQRGQPAAAIAAFREALRAVPHLHDARNGIVTTYLAERKFDAARTEVAAWQKANPDDLRVTALSGRVELAAGDMAAAERVLAHVVARDASQLEAYELLGRLYAIQGKIDHAIQQYEALAQNAPANAPAAKTMIGMLHEARKDKEAARAAYEQALAADPAAGIAANNLAWMYANEGKLDDALRLATVAEESLRRRPEAQDTLGWVYLQKGMASQALAAFERARDRAPQNPIYHYHLGLAHVKLGAPERARAAFTRALELRHDFAGADDARAQLAGLEQTIAAK